VVTGSRHGLAGFENLGRGARPSQLIASVRRTWGTRPGLSSGTPMRPILLPCFSRPLPVTERFVCEVGFFAP